MDTPMQKLLVSITEAAEVLSLSRSTIYELMDAGELTKVKFGRRTITVDSIKAAVKPASART
jgi:excisionase family DNA binding protein